MGRIQFVLQVLSDRLNLSDWLKPGNIFEMEPYLDDRFQD